jgi:hypothetical protein
MLIEIAVDQFGGPVSSTIWLIIWQPAPTVARMSLWRRGIGTVDAGHAVPGAVADTDRLCGLMLGRAEPAYVEPISGDRRRHRFGGADHARRQAGCPRGVLGDEAGDVDERADDVEGGQ